MRVRFLATICALAVSGCIHLPNSAAPSGSAEQTYGSITAATPIATVIRDEHIQDLDPGSRRPLLDQAMAELIKTDPAELYRGVTYDLTKGNDLERDWIVQTPDVWGRHAIDVRYVPLDCRGCDPDMRLPACRVDADCAGFGGTCGQLAATEGSASLRNRRVCLGHSDALVDRYYRLVASARRSVDIAELQPPADYRFLAALRNGVTALARSGRAVTIRVLVGQYPPDGVDAKAFLAELIRDARAIPAARLTVYASAMRSCAGDPSCGSFSWNHSKIIAIDGKAALVGGHNSWSQDYLIDAPVHDLSMQLRGPAVADADQFADSLWKFVCDNIGTPAAVSSFVYRSGEPDIREGCLPEIGESPRRTAQAGNVAILSVGRMGAGITKVFANHDDLARDLIFGAARHSILVSQQDLGFNLLGQINAIYPNSSLERWADFMLAGRGDIYVVLSNLGAKGRSKSEYSTGVPLDAVAGKMLQVVQSRSRLPKQVLTDMVCTHFHLAPLRFGPDATWPGNEPIGNHAKFWMVDGRYFYIGSDNLYPVDLQEFGYVVDDRTAATQLLHDYWEPLWRWSRAAAVSGDDAPRCVLRSAGSS